MIWRYLGGIWTHLGGIWESLEALWGALLGSPGLPGAPGAWEASWRQNDAKPYCFSDVNEKATILAESGEGDPHDLRSLRTKVGGRGPRAEPALTPPSL